MIIQLNGPKVAERVMKRIRKIIDKSRFTIGSLRVAHREYQGRRAQNKKISRIHINDVRLRKGRPYFGNQPLPSDRAMHRRGWGRGKPRPPKMKFLMAADWVEFLDILNDLLDQMFVNARIESNVVVARRGLGRRYAYRHNHCGEHTFWFKHSEDYEHNIAWNKIGLYPFSEFDEGCAGYYRCVFTNIPEQYTSTS